MNMESEKSIRKAPPSLSATASAIQSEIDLYRQTAAVHRKRAHRKTMIGLILTLVCVLAALALLTMVLLANAEKVEPLSTAFLYTSACVILIVLLAGCCFFAGSRDDIGLSEECQKFIEERRKQLVELEKQIREEKRREEEANLRVVEQLAPLPMTRKQKIAHALRLTSAVLSALSIPVAAIAALRKEQRKRK